MPYLVTKSFCLFLYYQRLQTLQVNGQKDFWTIDVRISLIDFTKILFFTIPFLCLLIFCMQAPALFLQ